MATEQWLIPFDDLVTTLARTYKDTMDTHIYSPREILSSVQRIHPVDARPVVHGRWLFVTKGQHTSVYVCSKCNRAVTVVCDEDIREKKLAKDYPYCHCGAQMDGGAEYG